MELIRGKVIRGSLWNQKPVPFPIFNNILSVDSSIVNITHFSHLLNAQVLFHSFVGIREFVLNKKVGKMTF